MQEGASVWLIRLARSRIASLFSLFVIFALAFSQVLLGASYSVSIDVTEEKAASLGDFVTHVFTIKNTGTQNDNYELDLSLPAGWITLGFPSSVQVNAGASEKLFVTFVVPSTAVAGTYESTLVATSTADPNVYAQATALITISPILGIDVAWVQEPPRAQPGQTVQGIFSLANTGNVSSSFEMKVSSSRNCEVKIAKSAVALFAGESTQLTLTVTPSGSATPGTRYSFTLEIASVSDPDIITGLVHSSRVAPPPPEKVAGSIFPPWPVTISLSFSEEGFTSAGFSGSGELEGLGTLSASTSLTSTRLEKPTGSYSTDDWRISLAGGAVSGGFGSVSGDGTGVSLFGKLGSSLSSEVIATSDVKGLSVSCRWTDGSFRIITGSDTSIEYGFEEIQFAQTLADALSITGSVASVTQQTISGTAFRISPKVKVGEYSVAGSMLNISPGFPNRSQEDTYSITMAYSRSTRKVQTVAGLQQQYEYSSLGITGWSLALDTSSTSTVTNNATVTTSANTLTGKASLSLPFDTSMRTQIKVENEKTDDIPVSTDQTTLSLDATIKGRLFTDAKYSFSVALKEPIDRVADTRYLSIDLGESFSFSFGKMDITSSVSIGRITDLKTGEVDSDSSSFTASLSVPTAEMAPQVSLSVSNGTASLGIKASWGGVSASASIPVSADGSFSASISTRFSLNIPFFGAAYSRVTGVAFVDENGNGVLDSGEKGIPGLLLTLGDQEAITGNHEAGLFAFWPVKPGIYSLSLQQVPFGLAPRTKLPLSLNLRAGEHYVALPFEQYSSVSGIVYNDANQNGHQDAGESGIPGAVILATGAFGQRQAITSPTGRFNVRVEPGVVNVSLVESSLPKRFVPTTPAMLKLEVAAQESKRIEFGAYQKPREIIFTFGPPTAHFAVTPVEPTVEERVLFDASSSKAVGVNLVSYHWTFQHGETSYQASGKQITQKFSIPGTWLVTLVVTDANGLKAEYQLEVTVRAAQ
jgi:hypothetical protein